MCLSRLEIASIRLRLCRPETCRERDWLAERLGTHEVRSPRFIADTRRSSATFPTGRYSARKGADRKKQITKQTARSPSASPWDPPSTWHGFGCVSGMGDKHQTIAMAPVITAMLPQHSHVGAWEPKTASRVESASPPKRAAPCPGLSMPLHSLPCLPRYTSAGPF